MKAKDLARILMITPEMDVAVHDPERGSGIIDTVEMFNEGDTFCDLLPGFVGKNGVVLKDFLFLQVKNIITEEGFNQK